MNTDLIEKELLYNSLVHLGHFYPLKGEVNLEHFQLELASFTNYWTQYNPLKPHIPRRGLSLTSIDGEMTGEELTSLREYNLKYGTLFAEQNFTSPTRALKEISSLHHVIKPFLPHLGRTHLIKFGEGGFFPTHRDNQGLGADTFRLVSLLTRCHRENFHFMYDNQTLHFDLGKIYFLNTKIAHSVFSFATDAVILVANVILTRESVQCVIDNLDNL